MAVFVEGSIAGRTAHYLNEAREMRRVAALLSLRQDRAKLMQTAIEYEQRAAVLAVDGGCADREQHPAATDLGNDSPAGFSWRSRRSWFARCVRNWQTIAPLKA